MPDIKTKDSIKGTIKALDRAAVAGERMKDAYIRTKDKAEQSAAPAEGSPEEYASDRISGSVETAGYEAAHQFDKRGREAVKTTKENVSALREKLAQKKADQPRQAAKKQAEKQARQRTADAVSESVRSSAGPRSVSAGSSDSVRSSLRPAHREAAGIKTVDRGGRSIKQTARTSGSATIKTAQGSVKTASRSVKAAGQTTRSTIKTTQVSAGAARHTAQAAAKTSAKAAQAARAAAKKAAETAKATAKAAAKAVRAIIAGTKALITALLAGGWIAVAIILVVVLLGCAVSLFGGGSGSNSYTPVSAEVEAYDPLIRQYAKQYGIPEYVELIKAVMMQESGGRGLDPMQAAEGSFNTRYPHEPNGIQDPEYSIECGVQELKAALISAEVENPIDMEHIKLALQGYNFGNGYITWAVSNYGGYSYANAVEFSIMMAEQMGWSGYGDTQYVSHVLRYYPYGRAFTAGGNQAIVEVALTQIGNEGGQPYWSWYGFEGRVEWCDCFVSWCADQCGYIESGLIPKFSGCDDGVSWFQSNGQWQGRDYEPQPGDIIFFDWADENGQDGSADHVGIVEKVENGVIYTVEGNSGDACQERKYAVGSNSIYGYGCPSY